MSMVNYREEYYENPTEEEKLIFKEFLAKQGLEFEDNVDLAVRIIDDATDEMVCTGSIQGKVLKCIAVDQNRRGEGLSALILSILLKEQFKRERFHLFIFTSPKNIEESSGNAFPGFKIVAKTSEIVLLEMGTESIAKYLEELKFATRGIQEKTNDAIGAIVVNCNPFTLGHQYLIEKAASECGFLYVFVVTEDLSLFPTDVRYYLVKEGTKHLDNVLVLKGGDYIISSATFPKYFMKDFSNISLSQARLDVTIFGEQIAPALNITRRYVGEEPFDLVTNSYNQAMKEILIPKGIELQIIPRKEHNGKPISASVVRQLLREDNFKGLIELVPPSTYNFLISKEAKQIIERIKNSQTRH